MGRVLCSITADSVGWHDPLCGPSDAQRPAPSTARDLSDARNDMLRNGRDGLLIELAKWAWQADLAATVNFSAKVWVDEAGEMRFVLGHSQRRVVELRFEMDCWSPCPPRPSAGSAPTTRRAVGIALALGTARPDDECRLASENGPVSTTELYYR